MRRSSPMASSLSHGNFQAWGLHPEKTVVSCPIFRKTLMWWLSVSWLF
jgi:hypothetical protein